MYAGLCTYRDWMYYRSLYGRELLMDDEYKRDKFLARVQDVLAGVLIFAMIFGIMIVW